MQNYLKFVIVVIGSIVSSVESQTVAGACVCVPTGTCNTNSGTGGTGVDGTGQIVSFFHYLKFSICFATGFAMRHS